MARTTRHAGFWFLVLIGTAEAAPPDRMYSTRGTDARSERSSRPGGGPHAAATSSATVCDATPHLAVVWEGSDLGRPWHQGEPLGAELWRCVDDGAAITWTTQGATVVGDGAQVNVVADPVDAVTVVGCTVGDDGVTTCDEVIVPVAPARPQVTVVGVTTLLPGPGGRWVRAHGTVVGLADPVAASVLVFKHTDVYYRAAAPAAVAADGAWFADFWMASNVDVVDAVVASELVDLATVAGCTTSWCLGQRDAVSRRRSPTGVDGVRFVAAARRLIMTDTGDSPELDFLSALRVPLATGALVRSSLDSDVLYLYDQAVAATAFALTGRQVAAGEILDALVALQRADGAWEFGYRRSGTAAIGATPGARYAGAVAWTALAMNAYDAQFGTTTYRAAVHRTLAYLTSQLVAADHGRALRFNPEDLPATRWDERQLTAVEHALETLAAMEGAAALGAPRKKTEIRDLTRYLSARWTGDHFNPGYYQPEGENTVEVYLDTQALGALAFDGASTLARGLPYNCRTFAASAGFLTDGELGVVGYADFRWVGAPSPTRFVWTEGTAMMASALAVVGPTADCPADAAAVLEGVAGLALAPATRGIVASSIGADNPYGQQTSTAAAAWTVIARTGRNPLRP